MSKKKSILLFGEGKTEAFFLSHLRNLYRLPDTAIKIEHGRGGSRKTVVQGAISIAKLADYTGVIILVDSDRDDDPIPDDWCTKHKLFIKYPSPCIEALFLAILGDKQYPKIKNHLNASEMCKIRFQKEYLTTDRSTLVTKRLPNFLMKKMTRKVLEDARKMIPILDEILSAFEGSL